MCVAGALRKENRLLAALPPTEYERLLPELQPVYLPRKYVIYQPGEPSRHVYFPRSGMVSELVVLEDARTVEVGVIGNEGVVGIHEFYVWSGMLGGG
jgi:CRP-like cAMP-binding protein